MTVETKQQNKNHTQKNQEITGKNKEKKKQ